MNGNEIRRGAGGMAKIWKSALLALGLGLWKSN
jgi:hypothetical protein